MPLFSDLPQTDSEILCRPSSFQSAFRAFRFCTFTTAAGVNRFLLSSSLVIGIAGSGNTRTRLYFFTVASLCRSRSR